LHFPERIETFVKGKPQAPFKDPRTEREYNLEVKDFFGLGFNGTNYHLHGRLHVLPPQHGIPGFQRVTMVKYMLGPNSASDPEQPIKEWAYEGLVTPGNTFMVGRWWDLLGPNLYDRQPYCGPFIFWNVERTKVDEEEIGIEAALKYLSTVDDAEQDF
jgi:hypothetical protein